MIMSKIEITEEELQFMVFDLWMDKNIMNPVHLSMVLKDKIKEHQAKNNEVLDLVSKPFTKKQLDDAMRKAKEYDEDINWE